MQALQPDTISRGFDNMGKPVSEERVDAGMKFVRELFPNDSRTQFEVMKQAIHLVESDQSAIFVSANPRGSIGKICVTGRYRLLSELLVGGK